MKNCRNVAGASHRPSGPVRVANTPIMREPVTFTNRVPHGKVSPNLLAIKPEKPHRARLPSPPPINIQSAFHIIPNDAATQRDSGVISTEDNQAVFARQAGEGK